MDKDSLCRLCLRPPDQIIDILEPETEAFLPEIQEFFELFQLNISADPAKSSILCGKCHSTLKHFREFHSQCLENERIWDSFKTDDETIEFLEENDMIVSEKEDEGSFEVEKSVDETEFEPKEDDLALFFTLNCEKCDPVVNFSCFKDFQVHFRTIHDERYPTTTCSDCGKRFSKRQNMLDHTAFHANPDFLTCHYCDRLYSDRKNLRSHIVQMHGTLQQKPFECHHCGKRYARLEKLRNHVHIHMSYESKQAMKKFVCEECGQLFQSNASLQAHAKFTHLQAGFSCEDCPRWFKLLFDLQIHRRNEHGDDTGPPREQCPQCEKWYSNFKALRCHVKAVHERKNAILCNICGMKVASKQSLYGHVKLKHRERKFHCEYCEKSFQTANRLKEHTAGHTGVTLYRCMYCPNRGFNARANMYKHYKAMHHEEWTRDKTYKNQHPELFKSAYHDQ